MKDHHFIETNFFHIYYSFLVIALYSGVARYTISEVTFEVHAHSRKIQRI
jgi:hypothetical protein